MKIRTSHFPRVRYNNCKFGPYRSITKGNLLISKVTLTLHISVSFRGRFLGRHNLPFPHMRQKQFSLVAIDQ
jgi:hypothetical protein